MDRGQQLLHFVRQRPADFQARQVYADWLLEQNDPRGEFLMLQFKKAEGTLSLTELQREQQLLWQHGSPWMGKLWKLGTQSKYERGFIAELAVTEVPAWAVGDPHWATVHTLTLSHLDRNAVELLLHPVMRGLRRVTLHNHEELGRLLIQKPGPICFSELSLLATLSKSDRVLLETATDAGSLKRLYLPTPSPKLGELEWVFHSPLSRQLESVQAARGGWSFSFSRGTDGRLSSLLAYGHSGVKGNVGSLERLGRLLVKAAPDKLRALKVTAERGVELTGGGVETLRRMLEPIRTLKTILPAAKGSRES